MASLPSLRILAGLRRTPAARRTPASPPASAAKPDPKTLEARRLRAEDHARRTTSVAPPSM